MNKPELDNALKIRVLLEGGCAIEIIVFDCECEEPRNNCNDFHCNDNVHHGHSNGKISHREREKKIIMRREIEQRN